MCLIQPELKRLNFLRRWGLSSLLGVAVFMVNSVAFWHKLSFSDFQSANLALEAIWMENNVVSCDDFLVENLLLADEAL
jgi:hypothetical protein